MFLQKGIWGDSGWGCRHPLEISIKKHLNTDGLEKGNSFSLLYKSLVIFTPQKFNSKSPWKNGGKGRQAFPIGFR